MAVSKFTPEARHALIQAFTSGASMRDAAAAAGLSQKTVKGWLTRGRKETEGPYAEFARAVDGERADSRKSATAMDADELAVVVSQAARRGNTQAMKLRWDMLRAGKSDDQAAAPAAPDGLDAIDELASRRVARA